MPRSTTDAERRRAKRTKAVDYLGGKCAHCGVEDDSSPLFFIHYNRSEAEFQVSQRLDRGWEILQPELAKCYLSCRSCNADKGKGSPKRQSGYDVTPLKRDPSPYELRQAQILAEHELAGQEYHAGLEVEFHNARVAAGKEGDCDCDFCEDARMGRELPQAYRNRLKDLRNAGNPRT